MKDDTKLRGCLCIWPFQINLTQEDKHLITLNPTSSPSFTLFFLQSTIKKLISELRYLSPSFTAFADVQKMGGKNRKSSNKAKTRKPRNPSYSGRGLFVEGGVLSDWAVYNSPPSRGSCFFFLSESFVYTFEFKL